LDYRFLNSWLGQGLLLSTGTKWHKRRKLLTKAFHFQILDNFLIVMNKQAQILCQILADRFSGGKEVDICPLVAHCALDIICETAMGQSVHAQDAADSPYVRAVYRALQVVHIRQKSPWLWPDWLFGISPIGMEYTKCLAILHEFTARVIRQRRQSLTVKSGESVLCKTSEDEEKKNKLALLDLLLTEFENDEDKDSILSDKDIAEEIDTFMFEGHDTTAANLAFTLFLLASHPKEQEKCQAEQDDLFPDGDSRMPTMQDLGKMKYLEACIKESLR
jgi:cytochrome P450